MSIYNALYGIPNHPVVIPERFRFEPIRDNLVITAKAVSELEVYRGTYVIDCKYPDPLEWCGLTYCQQDKVIEYIKEFPYPCIVFVDGRVIINSDRHYRPYVVFNAWGGVGNIVDGKWVLQVPEGHTPFRIGCINTGTGALTDFVCDHTLIYGAGKIDTDISYCNNVGVHTHQKY